MQSRGFGLFDTIPICREAARMSIHTSIRIVHNAMYDQIHKGMSMPTVSGAMLPVS